MQTVKFKFEKAEHDCYSRREGDTITFVCPVCGPVKDFCKGRKWFEADCEVSLSFAKSKLDHLIKSNPDDNWRLIRYYPRNDIEVV